LSSIITAKFFQDAILSQTCRHTDIHDTGKQREPHSILITVHRYGFGFMDLKKIGERDDTWCSLRLPFTMAIMWDYVMLYTAGQCLWYRKAYIWPFTKYWNLYTV